MKQTLKSLFVLLGVLLTVNSLSIAHSQSTGSPLVIVKDGDLYTWELSNGTGALIPKTNWHYNKLPVLSGNGQSLVYKSAAKITVDAIKQTGGFSGGEGPANLWLMNPDTGDAERIADQPEGATFLTGKDHYIMRSIATWSPDDLHIAWSQIVINSETAANSIAQIVLYDVAQKQSSVIVPKLPDQYGVPSAPQIVWGKAGLAVWSSTLKEGESDSEESLLIFNSSGELINTITIDTLIEFMWINDDGAEYLGVLAKGDPQQPLDNPQWLLVDPVSGRIFGMPGLPELYSTTAPNGLSAAITEMDVAPHWQIMSNSREAADIGNVDDVYAFTHAIGISADGKNLAYVQQGAAYISDGKTATKIADSDVSSLVWGPTAWRVRRQSTN